MLMCSETCLIVLLLALVEGVIISNPARNICYQSEGNPYLLFSTKTSYDVIRGNAVSFSVCKPIQFLTINRHGTRFPSPRDLRTMKLIPELQEQIINNYATGQSPKTGGLCQADLDALSTWKWNSTIEDYAYQLHAEGWRELWEIGQRYKKKYPELFSDYSEDDFYFRHTNTQRTWASCRAFIEGALGSYYNVKIEEPIDNDNIIKPYEDCSAWDDEVEKNYDFRETERKIFKKQPDYKRVVSDVSKRLGFTNLLNDHQIRLMYDNCRYDKSWYPSEVSPWCAVFSAADLIVMEYIEDLEQFYKAGFSHEFHPKLGCMPLKYMMEMFQRTINKQKSPRVIGLFSHDTLINLILSALNYGRDYKPLMGTNYRNLIFRRNFRSSFNVPFSANIAIILHECSWGDYQVQFFLNERPMPLLGCPSGLCSWEQLQKLLWFTPYCNLDFCKNKSFYRYL